MAEITPQTFLDAINESSIPTTDDAGPDEGEIRILIKSLLADSNIVSEDMEISESVAARLAMMIWPERALEVKRRKKELDVSRAAELEEVKNYIKRIMANG